jgi:hypothetical protein
MRKSLYILLVVLTVFLAGFVYSPKASAQVCNSGACVMKPCQKLVESCQEDAYGNPINCISYWQASTCCTIPQSGGGSCSCCDSTGNCYLNGCSGSGGDGGGGSGPTCGDASCNGNETCNTCATDCGACPQGTVRIRAVSVSSSTSTCGQVNASTSYIAVPFTLYPPGQTKTTPTDGSYQSWTAQPVVAPYTTYGFSDSPSGDYVYKLGCWVRTAVAASSGSGSSADLYSGSTLTWQVAYVSGVGWFQAQGGDVYASAQLQSLIPSGASPRYFDLAPTGGTAGVVSYGSAYDFANGSSDAGDTYISSPQWLANETHTSADYYAVMYHRFGSPAADYTGDTILASELLSRDDPYFIDGNLTISTTDWSITNGENVVVFVDGNLTINRSINLSGTGFVSFIVNGDISIDPSVGVAYSSSAPVIEGVYITSTAGTFSTGASSNVGTERFVAEGMFIAGDFNLQRDLDSIGRNTTTASELFIYNPQLLITMPEEMKDIPVTWQEVAP